MRQNKIPKRLEKNPAISVVIPIYNAQEFLGQTLASIAAQTFGDFEVIGMDDGSTDESAAIFREFAENEARFFLWQRQHQNASHARNCGLKKARGQYVIFFDADDLMEENALEVLYNLAKKNHAKITLGNLNYYDNQTGQYFTPVNDTYTPPYFNFAPWNKLYEREWLLKNNFWFQEIKKHNDVYFHLATFTATKNIVYTDEILFHYRVNTKTSITNSTSKMETWKNIQLAYYYTKKNVNLVDEGWRDFLESYYFRASLDTFWKLKLHEQKVLFKDLTKWCKNVKVGAEFFNQLQASDLKKYFFDLQKYPYIICLVKKIVYKLGDTWQAVKKKRRAENLDKPLVSVVMATYNHAPYLLTAVKSILCQSYDNLELIIVDDGSTDKTSVVLAEISDGRVKIVRRVQNKGASISLNEGLKLARGRYVARMDDDDVLKKNRLALEVDFLEKNPEVIMVGARMRGTRHGVFAYPVTDEEIRASLLVDNVFSQPTLMWRRKVFEENNLYYDEKLRYAEDYELWTRVIKVGKVANLPAVLLKYREHDTRTTVRNSVEQSKDVAATVAKNLVDFSPELATDKKQIEYYFDFSRHKSMADLQKIEDFLQAVLVENKTKKVYPPEILQAVLANKYLSFVSNEARFLPRGVAHKIWQKSFWKKHYRGQKSRPTWLMIKSFLSY